ncbi:MAG: lysylphosphatidylglycerol synthase domain-containing protein [Nitriliruptoraceae bacterium]
MSVTAPPAGSRYLVSSPDQPRVRRAGDVTSVLFGALLLLWALVNLDRVGPLNRVLAELVELLPSWSLELLSLTYSFAFLYGVVIILLLASGGRAHRQALRDVLLAMLVAAVIGVVLVRVLYGSWPYVVPELSLARPERQTPVFRVAVITATLIAASPHLVRPLRRVGWSVIALAVLAGSGLGFGLPSDAVGAIGVGWIAAGAVFLVLGAPTGLPDLADIARALERLGTPVTDLRLPSSRSWGVRPVLGRRPDGAQVVVKVYGRDATDQQLLAKLWRSLWFREQRRTFTFSRLQSVQQEALLTLWAARAGVRVRDVITAGAPDGEIALLALTTGGSRLDELPSHACSDRLLTELWTQVATLQAAGIAHGSLDTRAVKVDGEQVVLEDLGSGSLSASEAELAGDVASLLYSLAALVGASRAVAAARAGLGDEAVAAAWPYLQLPAITTSTRSLAEQPKDVIAALDDALHEQLGRDRPEHVELRRVQPRTLVVVLLAVLAAWTLVPVIAGIDLAAVGEELAEASWPWLLVAAVLGQGVFITEATSMLYATTASVPFRPLVVLQVAAKMVGVVTPGVTGTVATNAAFLSRYGVSPTASLTQGTMDAVAGVIVEVVVLSLAFGFSDLELAIDLSARDLELGRLGLAIAVIVLGAAVIVALVPRLRAPLGRFVRTVWDAARVIVAEPVRAVGLLGGNLGTRIMRSLVLWAALVALDERLGLGVVLVVVIVTGLLQAIVPVPGGIGVTEAVMTGLLVGLGVAQAPAFAAVVVYRVIIFYAPIVQGAVAMAWLTRNGHL